jgi:hypothetical protein
MVKRERERMVDSEKEGEKEREGRGEREGGRWYPTHTNNR